MKTVKTRKTRNVPKNLRTEATRIERNATYKLRRAVRRENAAIRKGI